MQEILLLLIIPLIESAGQDRASILRDVRQPANWEGAVRQYSRLFILFIHLLQ